jgi:hypothetical protein
LKQQLEDVRVVQFTTDLASLPIATGADGHYEACSKWADFNKVYVTYFKSERLPACSGLGANGLAMGAQVELECWAFAGK